MKIMTLGLGKSAKGMLAKGFHQQSGRRSSSPATVCVAVATATLVLAVSAMPAARAELITYFNFNGGATSGTATAGNYASSGGLQTATLTPTFASTAPSVFGGSLVNAVGTDVAGVGLAPVGGVNNANNGGSIQFSVAGTNLANLVLSYATQRTTTGFTTQTIAYSTDGATFTDFISLSSLPTSYALEYIDMSSITALNGAATDFFRITFTGATAASGNDRIDNLQLNTVPEPTTVLGGILLVGAAVWSQRRRLRSVLS